MHALAVGDILRLVPHVEEVALGDVAENVTAIDSLFAVQVGDMRVQERQAGRLS